MRTKGRTSNAVLRSFLPALWLLTATAGATYHIPTDTALGTWDPDTRTYTLTTDAADALQIDDDNLTFDGAGHAVNGPDVAVGFMQVLDDDRVHTDLRFRGSILGLTKRHACSENRIEKSRPSRLIAR